MKFLLSALVSPVCIIESLSDETVGPRLFYVNSQKTRSREKKLSKNWGEETFFSYPPLHLYPSVLLLFQERRRRVSIVGDVT